jgi:hypothetical protein
MSTYFEPSQQQQTTQTDRQDQDEFEVTTGVEIERTSFSRTKTVGRHSRGCHLGIGLEQVRKTP